MIDSAIFEGSLRERKRAATRAAITAVARSLTAERGLNGYTVEEVCEKADISRRTFFNYFPSKEDAIIGHIDDAPQELFANFVSGGSSSHSGEISATLLQDLVQLSLDMSAQMSTSDEEARQLFGVVKREPQLMLKFIGASQERDAHFVRLVSEREGLPPDHPLVQMTVMLFGALARKTSSAYFAEGNKRSYRELLLENVRAAQTLLAQPLELSPASPTESAGSTPPAPSRKGTP